MSHTTHVTAVERQAKLKRLATEKFRVVGGRVETYKVAPPAQDVDAVVAAAKERERLFNPQIGDKDERGVFLGTWSQKDKQGNSLGKIFNVFAAPEDLQDGGKRSFLSYKETAALLAGTKILDYQGGNYENDTELYAALRDGSYKGEWVIPPDELLQGGDPEGNLIQPDNFLAHWQKGAFKDTFCTTTRSGGCPEWYWSCTENDDSDKLLSVLLTNGVRRWFFDDIRLSCRPVRLEPKP